MVVFSRLLIVALPSLLCVCVPAEYYSKRYITAAFAFLSNSVIRQRPTTNPAPTHMSQSLKRLPALGVTKSHGDKISENTAAHRITLRRNLDTPVIVDAAQRFTVFTGT